MTNETNIAYLVRGEPYNFWRNYIPDGLFAAGASFDSNSLYNRRRLVVPGRLVLGDFEQPPVGPFSRLALRGNSLLIDANAETLRRYEEHIRSGKLEPERQWSITNRDLQELVQHLVDRVSLPPPERVSFSIPPSWVTVPMTTR